MAALDDARLFEEKKPLAGSAVWACVVYSLVPFVGVVFVPFIFGFGAITVLKGERTSIRAMAAGVVILIVQLALWWLLYAVPKWSVING